MSLKVYDIGHLNMTFVLFTSEVDWIKIALIKEATL